MAGRWEDIEQLLVNCATDDLESMGQVRPALAAFTGEALQFIAWLREFDKGGYRDPLTELFALAMPLDADRLAVSFGGRAWSMEDPIPPVTDGADLRQRILMLNFVDGTTTPLQSYSRIHPYELVDGKVAWQKARELTGGEGWIHQAMEVSVKARRKLAAPDEDILAQARRVAALGHDLHLGAGFAARLTTTRWRISPRRGGPSAATAR